MHVCESVSEGLSEPVGVPQAKKKKKKKSHQKPQGSPLIQSSPDTGIFLLSHFES